MFCFFLIQKCPYVLFFISRLSIDVHIKVETQAHLLSHITLSKFSLFLLYKRLKLKKRLKSWEKNNCIFQDFEHFFNFKRLYSKNKEKFESAIWLKRCARVSTFMHTSIESLKIKNKTYGHFCIKKKQKTWT